MEPITWGALGGFILFVISVSTFTIKAIKDLKESIRNDMNERLIARAAEAQAARDLISVKVLSRVDNLKTSFDALADRVRVVEVSYASKENLKELREGIDGVRSRLDDLYALLTKRA